MMLTLINKTLRIPAPGLISTVLLTPFALHWRSLNDFEPTGQA